MIYSSSWSTGAGVRRHAPVALSESLKANLIDGASGKDCVFLLIQLDDTPGKEEYYPLPQLYRTELERVLNGIVTGNVIPDSKVIIQTRAKLEELIGSEIHWQYDHPFYQMDDAEVMEHMASYSEPLPVFETPKERAKHCLEGVGFSLAQLSDLDNPEGVDDIVDRLRFLVAEIVKNSPLVKRPELVWGLDSLLTQTVQDILSNEEWVL